MMNLSQKSIQKNMYGFTMVELMVAVMVLAIGLLGLAGLQIWGLSNNHNAYLRTLATLLAQDVSDQMRSFVNIEPSKQASYGNLNYFLGEHVECETATCEVIRNDLQSWKQEVAAKLPGGTTSITKTGSVYNITISWLEQESNPSNPKVKISVTKSFSTSFQP